LYEEAVDREAHQAAVQLGTLYFEGRFQEGVDYGEPDYDSAFYWFNRALRWDNVEAQFRVGKMYLEGKGVEKDNAKAQDFLQKAADQGHRQAKEYLNFLSYLDRQPE